MLHKEKPHDYIVEMEVTACIIECNGEILLLERCPGNKFWGTWSEPGGKLDPGENHEQAMIREIYEESWVVIQVWETEKLFKKYFRFDDTNIAITFFKLSLNKKPKITLSQTEHSDYVWVTPSKALTMNLIEDFDEVVMEIYNIKKNS